MDTESFNSLLLLLTFFINHLYSGTHFAKEYLCPKCGHFNRSARSRKVALTSLGSPRVVVSPSSVPDPHSSTLSGFPSASAGLSPPQLISQGTSPSSQPAQQSSSSSSRDHDSFLKLPLSASTVFVEKSDAENQELEAVGYDVKEPENTRGEHTMQMDVDS